MKEITIYTDGACRGNPGPGGFGSVLIFVDSKGDIHRKELSGGYRLTTNNRMEILAFVEALEALKEPCSINLYSDSKYVVDAITQGWIEKWKRFGWYKDAKRKEKAKNVDLWKRLEAAMDGHEITFHWVKGHADNRENNRCDELAVSAALNSASLKIDEIYEAEQKNNG